MLIKGSIPTKEPLVSIGLILPVDKQKSVNIKTVNNLDYEVKSLENYILVNGEKSNQFYLEELTGNFSYNINPVTAGRGFHWQKQIDISIKGSIKIRNVDGYLFLINEIGIDSDNTIAFNAPRISLGGPSARESIIKGNKFIPQFKLLVQQLNNLASALEKARVWPNGVEAPDPVVVPIATSIKGVTDDLLDLLNDKKQPLLSKVVKTL